MLNVTKADVAPTPFPHIVSSAILDDGFYRKLRADFPDRSIFDHQREESGTSGSRTGSGFDIYRGDDAYERLLQDSAAWKEFDAFINSPDFIESFLTLFGPYLDEIGCSIDVTPDNYDRDFIEGRDTLAEEQTRLGYMLNEVARQFRPSGRSKHSSKLFTRLDIHKATSGYAKNVHCDRPNRLCSLIVYFCDADRIGIKGGDLTIHAHKEKKPFQAYERHPKPENAPTIATLRAKENQGVFFPCCNNSYHGVTAVETNGVERDYLYINISGVGKTVWR